MLAWESDWLLFMGTLFVKVHRLGLGFYGLGLSGFLGLGFRVLGFRAFGIFGAEAI